MTKLASDKQIAFITRLFDQAKALTEQTGDTDLATASLTPIQPVLVKVLSTPEVVTMPEAKSAIDTLLAFTKVAQAKVNSVSYPALAAATRTIPNKFAKACGTCGTEVPTGEGFAALMPTGWATYCVPCAKGEARTPAAPAAPAYSPERGDVHVVEVDGREVYVRVSISQRTGRPYANEWTGNGYSYAPGLTRLLTADNVATAEQAAAFGAAYGQCCFCARQLDTPESISVGYGPTCAARRNLPWG